MYLYMQCILINRHRYSWVGPFSIKQLANEMVETSIYAIHLGVGGVLCSFICRIECSWVFADDVLHLSHVLSI